MCKLHQFQSLPPGVPASPEQLFNLLIPRHLVPPHGGQNIQTLAAHALKTSLHSAVDTLLLLVLAGYKVTSVSSYVGNTMSCVEWLPHQENIGMVLWALVTRGQSPDK